MSGLAPEFNILVSSAGRRVALVQILRRTLSDLGLRGRILATEITRVASAWQAADGGFLVPRCSDSDFVPELLKICRSESVQLLVPTIDPELEPLATARAAFADVGTTVVVSSPEVVRIGADKMRYHGWLMEHGFPATEQTDLWGATNGHRWQFPLVVKPRDGSGSVGMVVVADPSALEFAARGRDVVVEKLATGREYSIDALVDRSGRCVCAVPRERIEVRAGEVSKSITVRSQGLEKLAVEICNALPGAYGPLTIQCFWDQTTGVSRVTELNPRFGGGFPLSWQAGARFPQWIIEELLHYTPSISSNGWRDGLLMLRYDDAVFVDQASDRA